MAAVLRKSLCQGFSYSQIISRLTVSCPSESSNICGSICIIPVRTKISKSSPFGKRPNPKAAQREDFMKKNPNMKDMVGKNKSSQSPVIIDSTGTVVSNYVPLQKKAFILTPTGIMQRWEAFKNGLWTVYSLAFVRKYCKPFKLRQFAEEAQEIYIEVNRALVSKDKKKLEELATGSVYHALRKEFFPDNKQLHWRFVKQNDRPQVVHARVVPVDSKENLFAQVTVKINSEQVVAVKNQYGQHLKGSDKVVKQLTDYVVLERHLPNKYGRWRVCGKVFQPTQNTKVVNELPSSTQPSV